MTVEWNTRRMMVMSKSTKGKNDRMALAATEKANVCTSVRNKYFTVDSTSPKRELCANQDGLRSFAPHIPVWAQDSRCLSCCGSWSHGLQLGCASAFFKGGC